MRRKVSFGQTLKGDFCTFSLLDERHHPIVITLSIQINMKEKEKMKACYIPPHAELFTLGKPCTLLLDLSMESSDVRDYGEEASEVWNYGEEELD